MQEEWKKEQDLVIQLQDDIQFKEEQLQNAIKTNTIQRNMIDVLKADLNDCQDKMDSVSPVEEKVKRFSAEETLNNGLIRIEELERLLLERTESLEECKEAFDALKQENKELQQENCIIASELGEAQRLMDVLYDKIEEQERLIQTLGAEVENKFALEA